MRKTIFENNEYYHIYNRGVDKRNVFLSEYDYKRFLINLREFNRKDGIGSLYLMSSKKNRSLETKSLMRDLVSRDSRDSEPLVELVCYCLNSNHFHILIKQLQDDGISKFMLKVSTGYTAYFNSKNERSGSLFQGPFKAIHIDSNEYFLYLSAYINCNHFIHGYEQNVEKPSKDDWVYSSLLDYLGKRKGNLCNKNEVLDQFGSIGDYANFIDANAMHLKEKKEMEKLLLE